MRPAEGSRGPLGQRAAAFAIAAVLIGVPAVVLRVLCVGDSCSTSAQASAETPFCSLPDGLRRSISAAVRDGRSGELLAATRKPRVIGGSAFKVASKQPLWPSLQSSQKVPIVFAGSGVQEGVALSPGAGLDDVAPTIARVLGFDRSHPEIRSGEALDEAAVPQATPPRLVVVIAWKGVGSNELRSEEGSWPTLQRLMEGGASTVEGDNNALSADPAGPLTTLGTGGVPAQHGMTGTLLRNDAGRLVTAWGPGSPINVIATLSEDIDEALAQAPLIALVGSEPVDHGLVGGDWYVRHDRDQVSMLSQESPPVRLAEQAVKMLELTALGNDEIPDLLAVALDGPLRRLDDALAMVVDAASNAAGEDVLVVVAGTGSDGGDAGGLPASDLVQRVEDRVPGPEKVVEAVAPGEVFVDQEVLAERQVSDDVVLDALLRVEDADGPLFADVFPSVAVTFGRFC